MRKEKFEIAAEKMRQRNSQTVPCSNVYTDCPPPLTVQEVAKRLNRSSDWTRRFFSTYPGCIVIPSPKRRGVRKHDTVLIPVDVLNRFLQQYTVAA
jgi:hypothetical protein